MSITPQFQTLRKGFSLVEMLIVIAVIGIVAAIAIPQMGGIRSSANNVKLQNDVKTMNSAVKAYLGSGGKLEDATSEQEVIDRLKSSMSAEEARQHVGFSNTMIDYRTVVVPLDPSEIDSDRSRVVWDPSTNQFKMTDEKVDGIVGFRLNEGLVPPSSDGSGDDNRQSTVAYSKEKESWVWDFDEVTAATPDAPFSATVIAPKAVDRVDAKDGSTTPDSVSIDTLAPPRFSIRSGTFLAGEFDLRPTITDPNPPAVSEIFYRIGGGNWVKYTGGKLSVGPDQTVMAYASSKDPNRYQSSTITQELYQKLDPVQLNLTITPDKNRVDYFDLTDRRTYVDFRVTNVDAIPASYRQAGIFDTVATLGGNIASTKDQRLLGEYAAGYYSHQLELTPDMWTSGATLVVKGIAKSSNETYVKSSTAESANVTIQKLTLERPSVTVRQAGDRHNVTLGFNGKYPPGSQIYYSDGDDVPSWNSRTGKVTNGTLYTGQFALKLEEVKTEGGGNFGNGGTVNVGAGVNDANISQVVLRDNGRRVVQNRSYDFQPVPNDDGSKPSEVVDTSSNSIEIDSITINQGGKSIVADNINVLNLSVRNLNFPSNVNPNYVKVWQNDTVVSNLNGGSAGTLKRALEGALSSTNLRHYIDYSSEAKGGLPSDFDFDVMFSPMRNSDFLVVTERLGNSTMDLRALDSAGNLIPGSSRVVLNSFRWNTGYSPPGEFHYQPMYIAVIDIEKFGVNTDATTIAGFRINNDLGADFKFFSISDESFVNRRAAEEGQVQARVFPPAGLKDWFEPSPVATRQVSTAP